MPQFFVPLLFELGMNAGLALIVGEFIGTYGLLIGGLALAQSQARKAKRKAREQYNASQVDRLVNISSAVAARELVLGRVRKGGTVFFKGSTGANNTTFLMAIALAAHEVDALEGVYFNDELMTLDGSGNVTSAPYYVSSTQSATDYGTGAAQTLAGVPIPGTVRIFSGTSGGPEGDAVEVGYTSGGGAIITTVAGATIQYQYTQVAARANVRLVSGTSTQVADARMIALFPTLWTSAHQAKSVAYLVVECTYDEAVFTNGLPTVTAVLRGAKIYDPRYNLCVWSEDFSNAAWQPINTKTVVSNATYGLDGTLSGDTLTDGSVGLFDGVYQSIAIANDAVTRTFSIFVEKTGGGTSPTFGMQLRLANGTPFTNSVRLNTDTGAVVSGVTSGIAFGADDYGVFWRLWCNITNNATGNTVLNIELYACTSAYGGGVADNVAATGSNKIWGACLTESLLPGPYCRTAGSQVLPVTQFTENPALMMRHVYQHPSFGKAVYLDPRTNLALYSEDFTNAVWGKINCTVTPNAATAPNGTPTADKIVMTGANDPYVGQNISSGAAPGGRTFTWSIWAWTDSGQPVEATLYVYEGSVTYIYTRALVLPFVPTRHSFTVTFDPAATNTSISFRLDLQNVSPPVGGYAYAWGAQFEEEDVPTDYFATSATARTAPVNGTVSPTEEARFCRAADACDRAQLYTVGGIGTSSLLYRAASVFPFGMSCADAFDDLAQAMGGMWAYQGGELFLKAGVYSRPVTSFAASDVVAVRRAGGSEEDLPISVMVHKERQQKFNVVNAVIWDKDQAYKQTSLTPLKSNAYIAADGGIELAQQVEMPAVFYAPQALHIAGIMLRDARDPLVVTLNFKMRAMSLELFDHIYVTIARYGWASKEFIVISRSLDGQGSVQVTLKETNIAIVTVDAAFSAQGYASNTALPSPWSVAVPGPLTITSGTVELLKNADGTIVSRMRVAWPAIDDSAVTGLGTVEVQYRDVLSNGEWSSVVVAGNETDVVIADVQDRTWYTVRARARTRLSVSKWSNQQTHQVQGKTEPPPPFDFFTALAQPDGTRQYNFGYSTLARQPVDWLGAEIRYVAGTDPAPVWSAMTLLQDLTSYYTNSPMEINAPLSGTYTFACKSIDTTGNESTYLLNTITLPDRRLGNVFDEFFEHLEGWTGVKTGCHVQSGILEANDAATWATPASWTAWTRWNTTPTSPITYVSPVRDFGTVVVGQLNATVDADGTVLVEYATSTDGTTFTAFSSAIPPFSTRYLKVRLTVTATGPAPVPVVRTFSYQVNATIKQEYINDIVLSALTGSYRIAAGDVRVPLAGTYSVLKRLSVVIQDSSAGTWTWARIDNVLTFGPRVQFRLGGVLTDPALVDFFVEGY